MPEQASPSTPWTVLKFGGAGLADGAGVRRVCSILRERAGPRPLAVVSAIHGVTNALEVAARTAAAGRIETEAIRIRHRSLLSQLELDSELVDRHLAELATVLGSVRARGRLSPEERDHVLSFGERMSARIVAAALRDGGVSATPVDAFDLGLRSDSNHGRARPIPGTGEAVRAALERVPGIPVVTGFVAADAAGHLTTLGRNGSDLSAALIAESVSATEVQFWKTVGGVMSADPGLVPDARPIRALGYSDAAEYAFHGASVLHPDALGPLQRAGVAARVLCLAAPEDPGTRIGADAPRKGPIGIACRAGFARVAIDLGALEDRGERSARFFAALERQHVETTLVANGPGGLVLVLPWSDELAHAFADAGVRADVERDLALLAAIGGSGRALAAIRAEGIRVRHAQFGEAGTTELVLVAAVDLARAARAAHSGLFEGCAAERPH